MSMLLPGRARPVHVRPDANLHDALGILLDNDYSQLPVVEDDRPIGMVTRGSILKALRHLGTPVQSLHVLDAVEPKRAWACVSSEADLAEVLAHLETLSAVLVTDDAGKLTHILTPWDMSEFFRMRSEDLMLVRDVETTLKDFLRAAFEDANGVMDEAALNGAVPPEPKGPDAHRRSFRRAVAAYLPPGTRLDDARMTALESEHFAPKPRTFDRVTFADYVNMFTNEERWNAVFAPTLGQNRKGILTLLEDVRKYRNDLAHFQLEVLPADQQERLRFAAEWMQRHFDRFQRGRAKAPAAPIPPLPTVSASYPSAPTGDDATPAYEDGIDPTQGRFARLGAYLRTVDAGDRIELPFAALEVILQGPLPPAALRHRAWWANQTDGHSCVWLDAGWRTGTLNLTDRHVAFVRIAERGRAYLEFFGRVAARVKSVPGFPTSGYLPLGTNWHLFGPVVAGVSIGASFTTRARVRAELYIDIGEQAENKRIFDRLAAHIGGLRPPLPFPVTFERLDERRASRIAIYLPGHITDKPDRLAHLEKELTTAVLALHAAARPLFD